MNESELMFALLRYELNNEQLSDEVLSMDADALWRIYKLSCKHDVYHLIADALMKNNMLPDNSGAKRRFKYEKDMAIYRFGQIENELSAIKTIFNCHKIPHMILKGAVIKRSYPESWMRTSCDLDILVKPCDLDKAIEILMKERSYTCELVGELDAQLFAKDGTHIELHFKLLDYYARSSERIIAENVWDSAVCVDNYTYEMSDDMLYCYHIAHIAKHIRHGGCGIRPVLDVWVLNNRITFDREKREALLSKAGLISLSRAIERLSDVWLMNAERDDLISCLESYLLDGGVFGTADNRALAQRTIKGNKFKYVLSRIFLPYEQLRSVYPKLSYHPYLYPFYQIKRWFKIFDRRKKEKAIGELDREVPKQFDELFIRLGIK